MVRGQRHLICCEMMPLAVTKKPNIPRKKGEMKKNLLHTEMQIMIFKSDRGVIRKRSNVVFMGERAFVDLCSCPIPLSTSEAYDRSLLLVRGEVDILGRLTRVTLFVSRDKNFNFFQVFATRLI